MVGSRKLDCKACNTNLANFDAWCEHMIRLHGERFCRLCKQECKSNRGLKQHERLSHTHTNEDNLNRSNSRSNYEYLAPSRESVPLALLGSSGRSLITSPNTGNPHQSNLRSHQQLRMQFSLERERIQGSDLVSLALIESPRSSQVSSTNNVVRNRNNLYTRLGNLQQQQNLVLSGRRREQQVPPTINTNTRTTQSRQITIVPHSVSTNAISNVNETPRTSNSQRPSFNPNVIEVQLGRAGDSQRNTFIIDVESSTKVTNLLISLSKLLQGMSLSDSSLANPASQSTTSANMTANSTATQIVSSNSPRANSSGRPQTTSGYDCCLICFEITKHVSALKCGHIFGTNCINIALAAQSSCPLCRADATVSDLRRLYLNE